MKDEFDKLNQNPVDESNENTSEWKFDGEAYTQNGMKLENDEFEIDIPASVPKPIDKPVDKPVNKTKATASVTEKTVKPKKAHDSNTPKFVLLSVFVAICIAVLSVLGVFYYNVPNSDEKMNPGNVALTVSDTEVSLGMYNYYYSCVSQRYLSYAQYGYYPDLDPTKDFDSQKTTNSDGKEVTWAELFVEDTINQLKYITAYYEAAVEAGVTLTDEQNKQIKEQLESLKSSASEQNKSVDEYIKETYGDYCGYATLKKMLEQCLLAENYYQQNTVTVKATDEEASKYFEEHKDDYTSVPFAYLQLYYDEEDFTKAKAEAKAKKYAKQIKSVEDMKKAIPKACEETIAQYVGMGYFSDAKEAATELAANIETSITKTDNSFTEEGLEWLFSDKTKVGACSTFTDEENGIVFIVLKTGEPAVQNDEVFTVRHILVMPKDDEGNALEDPAKGTEEQFAAAKKEAEALLAEFNKGDKSELSFALLAEEKSDDTETTSKGTSGIYGGLCEGTRLGTMVKPFEEWSVDKSRKYGDVDIVESQFGYHLIFFVEDTELYMYNCKKAVVTEKEEDFVKNVSYKLHNSVMKKTKVAEPTKAEENSGDAYDDNSDNMDY